MLKRITFWLVFATVTILGISAGAMLGEQKTLVPFWQELSPDAFFDWYAGNADRLKGFFAPLQIAGAVLALVTVIFCRIQKHAGTIWLSISMILAFAVLSTFFLFFKDVNASFVAQSVPPEQLSIVLSQWANWQWARIILGITAFSAALFGASKEMLNREV